MVLSGVCFGADAEAFVQTRTCSRAGDTSQICQPGQEPFPVYWADPCISYYINREGSDDLPAANGEISAEVEQAVIASFEAWNNTGCSSLGLRYGGLTCNDFTGKREHPNLARAQHVVTWRENIWDASSATIAVTLVNANTQTGIIEDADIQLNGVDFTFRNLGANSTEPGVVDIRNVLTHEVGHFIGLDHEQDIADATMAPYAPDGEIIKRDLHADDIQGACTIYPYTGQVCSWRTIDDTTCTLIYEGEASCAQAPAPTSPPVPWLPFVPILVGAGVGLGVRRRRW